MPDYNRTLTSGSLSSTPSMIDVTNGVKVNSGSPLQQIIFVVESGLMPFLSHWQDHVSPNSKIKNHLEDISARVSKEIHQPLIDFTHSRLILDDYSMHPINESFNDISKQLLILDRQDHERYENINSFQDSFTALAGKLF